MAENDGIKTDALIAKMNLVDDAFDIRAMIDCAADKLDTIPDRSEDAESVNSAWRLLRLAVRRLTDLANSIDAMAISASKKGAANG